MRLIAAAVSVLALAACSSADVTGEPVASESVTLQVTEKNADIQVLADAVNLESCPESQVNPDIAIPGLPNASFPCLGNGPDVNLSGVRGEPLVVNVWASWCPPCVAELPILSQAANDLSGEVRFLGITLQDDPASSLQMADDFDLPFASVVDPVGEVRGSMAIPGPPVTFFVRPNGTIAGRWDGALPNADALATLLANYLDVSWSPGS